MHSVSNRIHLALIASITCLQQHQTISSRPRREWGQPCLHRNKLGRRTPKMLPYYTFWLFSPIWVHCLQHCHHWKSRARPVTQIFAATPIPASTWPPSDTGRGCLQGLHSLPPRHTSFGWSFTGQGTFAKIISRPYARKADTLALIMRPQHVLIPLNLYRKQGHFLAVNNIYTHYLSSSHVLEDSQVFFLIFLGSSTYLVNGGKLLARLMCGRIIIFAITLARLLLRGSHLLPYSPAPPIGPPLAAPPTTETFTKLITPALLLQHSQKPDEKLYSNH